MTKVSEMQEAAAAAKSWPSTGDLSAPATAAAPDDPAAAKASEAVQLDASFNEAPAECDDDDGDRSRRRRQASVADRCLSAVRQKCGAARECAARTWDRCNDTLTQVVA